MGAGRIFLCFFCFHIEEELLLTKETEKFGVISNKGLSHKMASHSTQWRLGQILNSWKHSRGGEQGNEVKNVFLFFLDRRMVGKVEKADSHNPSHTGRHWSLRDLLCSSVQLVLAEASRASSSSQWVLLHLPECFWMPLPPAPFCRKD